MALKTWEPIGLWEKPFSTDSFHQALADTRGIFNRITITASISRRSFGLLPVVPYRRGVGSLTLRYCR